jgi:hypothetical protein
VRQWRPDLARLAETAATLGRWEFMLTIAPPGDRLPGQSAGDVLRA